MKTTLTAGECPPLSPCLIPGLALSWRTSFKSKELSKSILLCEDRCISEHHRWLNFKRLHRIITAYSTHKNLRLFINICRLIFSWSLWEKEEFKVKRIESWLCLRIRPLKKLIVRSNLLQLFGLLTLSLKVRDDLRSEFPI